MLSNDGSGEHLTQAFVFCELFRNYPTILRCRFWAFALSVLLLRFDCRIEYIATVSPGEALLLEASLIRQHQPPFNVLLKDDKRNCEKRLTAVAAVVYSYTCAYCLHGIGSDTHILESGTVSRRYRHYHALLSQD